MTYEDSIAILSERENEEDVEKAIMFLAELIARESVRGEWYSGDDSTNVSDWLEEGQFDGDETIEELIKEWDS